MTKQALKYSKDDLDKMLQKEVEISIADSDSEEEPFAFKGKIISYNLDANDSRLPGDIYFHTDYGSVKHFNISELQHIRVL